MVRNIRSGKIISEDAGIARNFYDKSLGMLLPKNSAGIILKTRLGIHSLFMKRPIDVIIVDKENKVVLIKKNFKPYRVMIWNPIFDTVIEVPNGAVEKSHTRIGDKLDF